MTRDPVKLLLANARREAKHRRTELKALARVIRRFAETYYASPKGRDDINFLREIAAGLFRGLGYEDVQTRLMRIHGEVSANAGETVRPIGRREWKKRLREWHKQVLALEARRRQRLTR
jgi:hypothetical protein